MNPSNPSEAPQRAGVPLWLAGEANWPSVRALLPEGMRAWLDAQSFRGERHRCVAWPDAEGGVAGAILGLGAGPSDEPMDPWLAAACPERLPLAEYTLKTALTPADATQFLLGWKLGSYQLTAFKGEPREPRLARLTPPEQADHRYADACARAMSLTRDLINTPANLLGPAELAAAASELAGRSGGECQLIQHAALREGFPLISAVGQGSDRAPLLIDCRWQRPGAPRVVLVGKGVCFDTGGLDIKPPSGMLLMKKDMGGAACALGLAQLLRELDLPIDLQLLIPAVENSVSGGAYRPGDVWPSRKGLRVEIGNTDAEGRLVLADALTFAGEAQPDLLIDLATLTGAARVALGPELPAIFSNRDSLLQAVRDAGQAVADPLWPLPLWSGYDDELASRVGDLNNVSSSGFAGAITAALFLQRFVNPDTEWLHIDLFGWNSKERPGRPVGAEAHCLRALYEFLKMRYGR